MSILTNIKSLAFFALLAMAHSLSAQTCALGELRVFVIDSQAAPVFDATVHVASAASKLEDRNTQTVGTADFEKLSCASWIVTASKDGFEPANKTVQITSGARAEVTLTLNPQMQVSSVDVTEKTAPVEQTSSVKNELRPAEIATLPSNPATVAEALPLIPGVVRTPDGELKIEGTGEHRSALVVNQTDITDPATGKFGQTIPLDSIETVNVLTTPFLAQYGRFTSGVVAVETKRGGEKWHAELNDPFPDFRIRSWHMRGIRNETPRGVLGGPILHDRLFLNTALQYYFQRDTSRTLSFPFNESKQEWINSFTQLDFILSTKQIVTATLHVSPQHTNFVNIDYFNPQSVAPSYAQHNYEGTTADHWGLLGGIVDSSISIQRFDAFVGAQGDAVMVLAPEGNSGNYFGRQNRNASRLEWLETWSPKPLRFAGTHLFKIGSSVTNSGDSGQFTYQPVDILDVNGLLLRRIDFSNRNAFSRNDREVTAFAQDHWALSSKIAFDYGARLEHQRLASSLRVAPRAGIAWTPFSNERTVFRAGYGQYYDHLPLDVYTFSRYPQRTITDFAPNGSVIGTSVEYVNVIGSISGPSSFLVHGQRVAGFFAPRGGTWNAQMEHSFSPLFHLRAVYTDNRSVGLVVLDPQVTDTGHALVLNGDGQSRYRQLELTSRIAWKDAQQLVFSYTHSRAEGNLNGFDTFLGNFPTPLIRPNVSSNLPGDLPNRFLMWGHVKTHVWNVELFPTVEYRNGFPYARLDTFQDYFGTPNLDSTRFPHFFSADARVMKDFKVDPKYTVRVSVTGFNLTNHFNALAVHANVADPRYGIFFGNYHRRYRGDFEIIF